MDSNGSNPVIITLFFLARCLVPLLIMLGISYLLRKWGLIKDPPPPPEEPVSPSSPTSGKGDKAHE